MFGLLGPNGAGKTTLMSILSCLLSLSSGEATLEDVGLRPKIAAACHGSALCRRNWRFIRISPLGRICTSSDLFTGWMNPRLDERVDAVLAAIGLSIVPTIGLSALAIRD